jgi:hypothetical protein
MKEGRRTGEPEPLAAVRDRVRGWLERLPEDLRVIAADPKPDYPVAISSGLAALVRRLERARH